MSPNEWQLLLNRPLAPSSCLIWPVLCVTFAEHSHSPGGGGGSYKKDWNLNILKDLLYVVDGTNPTKTTQVMLGEVGLRWEGWGWEFGGCWIKDSFKGS